MNRESARENLAQVLGAVTGRLAPEDDLDAALDRLLDVALVDLTRARPRLLWGSISVQPYVTTYPAPPDLVSLGVWDWGRHTQPWDLPTPLPRVSVRRDGADRWIELLPAPCAALVNTLGATLRFRYTAAHELTDDGCTAAPEDHWLLILRATAEAMQMLAVAGVVDPVQLHRGMGASIPSNSTPAAIHDLLLRKYREGVARAA